MSEALVKAINHAINNNVNPNALIEIEENPFLGIEQLDSSLIPILQKLGPKMPDIYMEVLGEPRRSDCNIKKKDDDQLCKRFKLYGKKSPGPKRYSRKNN